MPGQSNRPEGSSSALLAGGWRVPRACSCRADRVLPRMPTLWPAGCESAGCCRGLLRPKSPVGKDSGGWPDALVIGRYGVDAFRPFDIPVGRIALPTKPFLRFPAYADPIGIGSVSVPADESGLRILSSSVSWGNAATRDRVPSSPLCLASPPWVRCPAAWRMGRVGATARAGICFCPPFAHEPETEPALRVSGSAVQPVGAVLCPDVGSTLCGECQGRPTY